MSSNSRNSIPSNNLYSFIGFIFLPPNLNREEYIQICQSTEQVSVIDLEFNRVIHKVRVGRNTFKEIQFPQSTDSLGSAVICLNLEIREQYVVIDTIKAYDDVVLTQLEHSFRIFRKNNASLVDFHIKGLTGELDIVIDSGDQENIQSNWSFFNKKRKAFLRLYIQGIFHLIAEKLLYIVGYDILEIKIVKKGKDHIKLKLQKDKGIVYSDDYKNEFEINKDGNMVFNPKNKFIVGEENYSVVLGELMQEAVDNIIDELVQATIITETGPKSLSNAATIAGIKKKTAKTLSKYHFTK